MSSRKTDNHNLPAKLALRRYFLHRYYENEPLHVLDCCEGNRVIWRQLREEFSVASYWGLDVKPKKGRLKLDSVRVLAQPGWAQNVVDIDTYGSPWRHWLAMLPNIVQPTTVFLTIGRGGPNKIRLSKAELTAMGLTIPLVFSMSGAITHSLAELAASYVLTSGCDFAIITEAAEAVSNGNARYVGVRLVPAHKNDGQQVESASRHHTPAGKEQAHV